MEYNAGKDAKAPPLRILMVEDAQADVELVERQLWKAEIAFVSLRVETREDFLAALEQFAPDLILSDYSLPRFDGMAALLLARELRPLVPVIIVTGSINEETAVACMKAGADDYVLKDRLGRLGTAVIGVLKKRRYKAERSAAQEALRESEERLRTFLNATKDAVFLKDDQLRYLFTNQANTLFIGKSEEQILGAADDEFFPENMARACKATDRRAIEENDAILSCEQSGDRFFETLKFPVSLSGGRTGVGGFIRDITERRQAESLEHALYEIARVPETARSLDDLYRSVHQIIKGLMESENFYVALYDEKQNLLSLPYFVDEVDTPSPPRELGKGLTAHVIRNGSTLLCDAALSQELIRRGEVDMVGVPSACWLGVPLRAGDKTIGAIVLQHYSDPKVYGERERQLLEYVSSHIAAAIMRKRTEEALGLTHRTQSILNGLLRLSLKDMDLAAMLQQALDDVLAIPWLELTPKGAIFLAEEGALALKAQRGMPEALLQSCATVRNNQCLCGRAMATGEFTFAGYLDGCHETAYEGIMPHGHCCVPIASGGEVKGVMCLYLKEGHDVRPGERDLLEAVASVLAGIIQRKRAEEGALASEQKYHLLFERNLAGVYRSTLDGRILDCNEAFAKMFGYQNREEMSNLPAQALYRHPSDREEFISRLRKNGRLTNHESLLQRLDGSPLWLLENVSLIEESGSTIIEGTVIDITDWKKGQAELQLLSAAMNQAHDAIVVANPQGEMLYVNPAFEAITGYSREEATGKNPRLVQSGVQDKPFYEHLWATITSGETWSGRLVNKRKDGSLFTEDTIISPVLDEADAITAYVALKRDVTQEMELERRLGEARTLETIGMITGGVAHEVRNPLFAISTVSAALTKKMGPDSEFKPYLDHINDHVHRLSQLMDDLLALGRPVDRAGFTPLELGAVVETAGREVCAAHPECEGRLRVTAQGILAVQGLEPKLRQVFTNILQNAFHFTPKEAAVEVSLWQEGSQALFRVTDHGPGIPEEMLPKLFEPFQSRRKEGTGLGLAIVQKIVTAHGGTVEGANRTDGPGAFFTVRLPLAEEAVR